jgi:hypothetical protein
MYLYSCGSVPKRGTGFAKKTLRKWLDNDPKGTKYCLKMDISKYYPSIDNEILKLNLNEKIKDKDCLWLANTIIDSAIGLPIGNYTSQWFANYFLEGLDHFVKEQLHAAYYVRYVDDLVILGTNKKILHAMKHKIDHYLKEIDLKLKDNWQVFKLDSRDIDFLGYRFFRDRTILRKTNALRIRRRCKKIHKKSVLSLKDASAIISYWGWVKHSNSYRFYKNCFASMVNIWEARKVISYGNKKPVYDQSKEAVIEVIEKGKKHYKVVPLPVGDKGNLEEIRPEEAILQVLTIEERLEKLELKIKAIEGISRK